MDTWRKVSWNLRSSDVSLNSMLDALRFGLSRDKETGC